MDGSREKAEGLAPHRPVLAALSNESANYVTGMSPANLIKTKANAVSSNNAGPENDVTSIRTHYAPHHSSMMRTDPWVLVLPAVPLLQVLGLEIVLLMSSRKHGKHCQQ